MKIYKEKRKNKTFAGAVYHLLYEDKSFVKILYNFLWVSIILLGIYLISTGFWLAIIIGALITYKSSRKYYDFLKLQKAGFYDNKTMFGELNKYFFKEELEE